MQAVLNAALPIFALILVGFLCGRFGVFTREATDNINRFAIYLALPALIFTTMARITPAEIGQVGFSAAFALGIAATFAVAYGLDGAGAPPSPMPASRGWMRATATSASWASRSACWSSGTTACRRR